jgi:hypothetical protein
MRVLILPPKMAELFAAAGYEVYCTDGRVLDGSKASEDALRAELHEEFRDTQKAQARKMLSVTDASCDNIAAVLGLSAHTVRGMSTGSKNYRGKQERTELSYNQIMAELDSSASYVEW